MADIDYITKKQSKIIHALTRLKYSLRADDEIESVIAEQKRVVSEGAVPQLEATLADLLSELN